MVAYFAERNTKFGEGGKARAGKNSFPPTPFLFAWPSVQFGARSAAESVGQKSESLIFVQYSKDSPNAFRPALFAKRAGRGKAPAKF